jgi:hypothetical protein
MAKSLALSLVACTAILPTSALACSVVVTHEPTYREQMKEARDTIERASAIVDGEVIEPTRRDSATGAIIPATVRVHRVLKGDVGPTIRVGQETSCDISFEQPGQKWRFVLFGGPDVFTTWVDYSNARAIDRLLKSDRRKHWPLNPR